MRDELVKEMKFNSKYLMEKYGLSSIVMLASENSDDGDDVVNFEVMEGNRFANIELCRMTVTQEEECYKNKQYGEDLDEEY